MKATLRLPTDVQYGFLEIELEVETVASAVDSYNQALEALKPTVGLDDATWRKTLDEYLNTGSIVDGTELWARMSEKQRYVINEVKKSSKRTNV